MLVLLPYRSIQESSSLEIQGEPLGPCTPSGSLDLRIIRRANLPLQPQPQNLDDGYFSSSFAAPFAAPFPAFLANLPNTPESSSWSFAFLAASGSCFTVTGFLVVFALLVLFIFLGIWPDLSPFSQTRLSLEIRYACSCPIRLVL